MLEDRYSMLRTFSNRGEFFSHEGSLESDGYGIRTAYMMGEDGYDLITITNTLVPKPLTATLKTVLEG